jgi:hypothetical protein
MDSGYPLLSRDTFLALARIHAPGILLTYTYGNVLSRIITRVSNRWRRDKYEYAHAMDNIGSGEVATQNLFYVRKPLEHYLNDHTRVKLWYPTDADGDARAGILCMIADELNAPWYRRAYDGVGLVGQWLGNTFGVGHKVNVPGIHYCSERTARHYWWYLDGLRRQASPADIDRHCTHSDLWRCVGVYDPRAAHE